MGIHKCFSIIFYFVRKTLTIEVLRNLRIPNEHISFVNVNELLNNFKFVKMHWNKIQVNIIRGAQLCIRERVISVQLNPRESYSFLKLFVWHYAQEQEISPSIATVWSKLSMLGLFVCLVFQLCYQKKIFVQGFNFVKGDNKHLLWPLKIFAKTFWIWNHGSVKAIGIFLF